VLENLNSNHLSGKKKPTSKGRQGKQEGRLGICEKHSLITVRQDLYRISKLNEAGASPFIFVHNSTSKHWEPERKFSQAQ